MGIIQAVVTLCGVIGIIGLIFVLLCHHFIPGWTWTQAITYLQGTTEEKMVLTKPNYNSNGCMIPSSDSSEFHLSGRGSFRRFDKTDHDYTLLRQSSSSSLTRQGNNIPPQPLRPAPVPPYIVGGPSQGQRSTDSVLEIATLSSPAPFIDSATIPQPGNSISAPTHARGGGSNEGASGLGFSSFSNNNPFLPLLQASTQFFTQKFQSFQPSHNGSNSGGSHAVTVNRATGSQSQTTTDSRQQSVASHSLDESTVSYSASSGAGRSMGEILFSSPPAHSLPTETVVSVPQQCGKKLGMAQQSMNSVTVGTLQTIDVDIPSKVIDTKLSFPNNAAPSESDDDRGSLYKEQSSPNYTDHLDEKRQNNCYMATNLNAKSTTTAETIHKPDYQPSSHHNSPSPTRIRDRQRKMELTLQHIQNNQEDRIMSKKHYNPDSHYPVSTPYVPKTDNGSGSGENACKSRFRSPLRSVPTLKEADELEVLPPEPTTTLIKNSVIPLDLKEECVSVSCNKWILETMREEIRLENERMEDATKSLMMEDDFSTDKRKTNGMLHKTESVQGGKSFNDPVNASRNLDLYQLKNSELSSAAMEGRDNEKFSYANSNGGAKLDSKVNSNSRCLSAIKSSEIVDRSVLKSTVHKYSGIGGEPLKPKVDNDPNFQSNGASSVPPGMMRPFLGERAQSYNSPVNPPMLANPPFRNTRSFSLRQTSTDSVGSEGSDAGSPEGSLPSLQRAMSCDSVSSDTSIVMSDLDPPHPTGYLCVGLEYDCETADLLVNVMEAKELVGPDPNSVVPFDSYVRVYLLPDKTTNMQTRVYRKSLNPVYREKFMFGVETIELPLRTLVFYLYSTDKHSNTLVGETEVKLGDLDIYQPITTWLLLTDTGQRGGESGEIMFSLSYLPTAERLTVVVVKARNLKFPHERSTGDPFVKVYLLQKGKKVSKKKSSTKRGEKNPIFNEAMIFSVPAHALQTIQLRITVADSSEVEGRANSIGHVMVGSSATGKPLSHWNQMLSSLRKPIAMWHLLRK